MVSRLKLLFLWVGLASCTRSRVQIQMPLEDIDKEGSYMCLVTSVKEYEGHSLVGWEIDTFKDTSHHATAIACEDVNTDQTYWDCTSQQGSISKGRAISLQGKDGADIEHVQEEYPEDIGIELGPKAKVNYIVLQVHFKNTMKADPEKGPATNLTLLLTDERRTYTRQAFLLASKGYIPANTERFSSEFLLEWSGITVEADTYNIHTHSHGLMVEGYIIRNGVISLIGRQSPQHHGTSIYKMENGTRLTVSPGDVIAARCILKNPQNTPIEFGTANSNEMCNFGLQFRYPTESAMMYPRTVLRFQDPHEVTWCQNDVYTSQSLCDLSKNVLY